MVGSEIKNLAENEEFTLPSNARSIMIEIIANSGAGGIQIMTSHNGDTWHNVSTPFLYGGPDPAEQLVSFDDSSENFLQKIKITGITNDAKVNLFFGRSK